MRFDVPSVTGVAEATSAEDWEDWDGLRLWRESASVAFTDQLEKKVC